MKKIVLLTLAMVILAMVLIGCVSAADVNSDRTDSGQWERHSYWYSWTAFRSTWQ